MRKLLLAVLVSVLLATPVISVATECTLTTREKIDTQVSKDFPGFRPCLDWQQESAGLRRVYSDKPGIDLYKDRRYIVVTVKDNGAVQLYDGDKSTFLNLAP